MCTCLICSCSANVSQDSIISFLEELRKVHPWEYNQATMTPEERRFYKAKREK